MKKIFTLVAAALLVAAPALFTSCDDDPWYWYGDDTPWWYGYDDGGYGWNNDYYDNGGDNSDEGTSVYDEAEVLQGQWDGSMVYTNGDNGQQNSFYANMTFVRNNSNAIKGTGIEIDYTLDSNGKIDQQNDPLMFNWYIDEQTGDIYIKYTNTQNQATYVMDASAKQHGFQLDENSGTFGGYMLGTNNNDMIYIELKRVQNNSAKKLTRSTATTHTFFGSTSVTPVSFGTQSLTTRR
jgi:hypothetical protein